MSRKHALSDARYRMRQLQQAAYVNTELSATFTTLEEELCPDVQLVTLSEDAELQPTLDYNEIVIPISEDITLSDESIVTLPLNMYSINIPSGYEAEITIEKFNASVKVLSATKMGSGMHVLPEIDIVMDMTGSLDIEALKSSDYSTNAPR